jgi:hypothetical protein
MQKVEGSSPFIRSSKPREPGLLSFPIRSVRHSRIGGRVRENTRANSIAVCSAEAPPFGHHGRMWKRRSALKHQTSPHEGATPDTAALEQDVTAFVEALEVPSGTIYRLHSADDYVTCTRGQYEHLSVVQRTTPVRLMAKNGRRWWWYEDRFWWVDRRLSAREIVSTIVAMDLLSHDQREAFERAHVELFGGDGDASPEYVLPDHIRREVWIRNGGRCVDCGVTSSLVFHHVLPYAVGGSNTAPNLELRCRPCLLRRRANEARATVGRARIGAHAAKEWGVVLKDISWPRTS